MALISREINHNEKYYPVSQKVSLNRHPRSKNLKITKPIKYILPGQAADWKDADIRCYKQAKSTDACEQKSEE